MVRGPGISCTTPWVSRCRPFPVRSCGKLSAAALLSSPPFFLEELKGIGIEYFAPLVAVVTRRIATRKNVRERRANRHAFHVWKTGLPPKSTRFFDLLDSLAGRFGAVVIHINQAQAQLPEVGQTSQKVLTGADFLDQIARNHLARLVVFGKEFEGFGIVAPVFPSPARATRQNRGERSCRSGCGRCHW